jgi:general secretion pathway protein M
MINMYFSRHALIAVSGFFGLLFSLILIGAVSASRNNELQAEFENKSRILGSLGGQVPSNSRKLGRQPTGLNSISAPTETVAASQLHQMILTSLQEVGGVVHSIQAEPTTDTIGDGLRRLNAQISFDSSIPALQKLLFHLETTTPFVFIDSIVVQSSPTGGSTSTTREVLLRVTLVTSSYWKDVTVKDVTVHGSG